MISIQLPYKTTKGRRGCTFNNKTTRTRKKYHLSHIIKILAVKSRIKGLERRQKLMVNTDISLTKRLKK